MQSSSAGAKTKLQEALDIYSSVRLIAEWNQNRYSQIASILNTGTDPLNEYDNDVFPISSVVLGERPTRGILKAWSSTASGVALNGADGFTYAGYQDMPNGARYMTASEDAKYKYWTSPYESSATAPYNITNISPTVLYTNLTWANKIRVGLENSFASPDAFTVSITTDGTNWTVIATNPTINADGTVDLYRQANGTWASTVYRENPQQIRGVRLIVTSMDKPAVHFNLIELGARLESDISQFVVDYSVENSMSEVSFAAPIGIASSNTANVTLDNTDGRFTTDNPTVPLDGGGSTPNLYYGLLEKNVAFRLDFGINLGTLAAPNIEWFRQFTMRTDAWNGQDREGTEVELKDASDYLQSVNPNPFLYQDMTVGEVIWRILDSVGFASWNYDVADDDASTLIPYFWADGQKSVWETISELAEATQSALYFDEFGVLQIMTRGSAYNIAATPAWTLNAAANGLVQPDIVDLKKTYDFEANVVNIKYKPTSISKENPGGVPVMEVTWEPEDTVVLRSSQLTTAMTPTSNTIRITQNEAVAWPFTGIVQIEGEFIRYEGKGYSYRNAAGTWVYGSVKSQDEKVRLDNLNPNLAYQNYFNGFLLIKDITKDRGLFNSKAQSHFVDIAGWTSNKYRTQSGPVVAWNGGLIHNPQQGTLMMRTNKNFIPNSWYVATRGSSFDQAPLYYGTRLRFPTSGYVYGAAGIVINAGTNDNGYYAEIVRTKAISPTDRALYTHELCFYVRYTNGTIKRVGPDGGKGVPIQITEGIWYDLDVAYSYSGGNAVFNIAVNGVNRMTATVPAGIGTGETMGGRSGLFTRGFTFAEFEFYNTSTLAGYEGADEEGYWDRIRGGYVSGQWEREWVYGWRTQTKFIRGKKYSVYAKYNSMLMDEFGPVVHEVREFDVDFSKFPVLHSQLYLSNESQVICPEYTSTPFGAKFTLANTSRDNAVVSGEDTLTFGSDNAVDQKLLVYGRTFTQEDEKTETVKDDAATKSRGEISLDIDSSWIQTEAAAKALGAWIISHWSGGADEVSAKIFGNPLIQLGDVVNVNYALMNMTPATHEYFVVGVSHSYDNGLETQLTLRRRKI